MSNFPIQLVSQIDELSEEAAGRVAFSYEHNRDGHLLVADVGPADSDLEKASVQLFYEDSDVMVLRLGQAGLIDWDTVDQAAISDVLDIIRATVRGDVDESILRRRDGSVLRSTITVQLPDHTARFTHRSASWAMPWGRARAVHSYKAY
jgi:hypothetical protein